MCQMPHMRAQDDEREWRRGLRGVRSRVADEGCRLAGSNAPAVRPHFVLRCQVNDQCAVYRSKDTVPERTIFIYITHGAVFSYFAERDEFAMVSDENAHSWVKMPDTNEWWKRLV